MVVIDNVKLAIKYNIDLDYYTGKTIDFYNMSVRTSNCLKHNSIFKISDLLMLSFEDLSKIRNLGVKCLDEIDIYVSELKKRDLNSGYISDYSANHLKDIIFDGDFSDDVLNQLSNEDRLFVRRIEEAYQLLDKDLILSCRDENEYVVELINMFSCFTKTFELKNEINKKIMLLGDKLNNSVDEYYRVFNPHGYSNELSSIICGHDYKVRDLLSVDVNGKEEVNRLNDFVDWLGYDLRKEVFFFFDRCFKNKPKLEMVLTLRSQKHTLQEVGAEFGVTRERIRQMEARVISPFRDWHLSYKFLPKLSADLNGEKIIEASKIHEMFGERSELLIYLLQCVDDENYSYDKQTDTLVLESDNNTNKARIIVGKIPDIFNSNQLSEYISELYAATNISPELLIREVDAQFKLSGNYYHRTRLSLSQMYSLVLEKYYPQGMHVYDTEEIEQFKKYVADEFGDVNLPDNYRAISARIAGESILRGRGIYIAKKNNYISKELSDKIYRYIMDSDNTIFLTNTIYTEFEDELEDFGVDNRYYLHGILRELFGDKLYFTRDYVSKDANSLSIYRDIVEYIKASNYPVTKQQLKDAYPGITEIVLSFAVSDEKILNFRSVYVHVDNLKLYDSDIKYLKNEIEIFLKDNSCIHCGSIYDYISHDNVELLRRLGVFFQSSLFSLLEYLFREQYEFSRPYIAIKGTNVERPLELIEDYILSNDYVEIAVIFELAKDNHYVIYDQLKFLCSYNDTHLMINKDEMASIDYIGIKDTDVADIESIIMDELKGTSLISDLKCVSKLKKLNVPWNEWLIYSIIKKWGKELEVGTTSNQFRSSMPIISKKNEMKLSDIDSFVASDSMAQVDNIDDFDKISDALLDDIEW